MVIHIQKDFFCKNGMYVSCVCAPIVPVCPYLVCVLFSLVNKCSALSPEFINLLAYSFDFSVFISPVFCLGSLSAVKCQPVFELIKDFFV